MKTMILDKASLSISGQISIILRADMFTGRLINSWQCLRPKLKGRWKQHKLPFKRVAKSVDKFSK